MEEGEDRFKTKTAENVVNQYLNFPYLRHCVACKVRLKPEVNGMCLGCFLPEYIPTSISSPPFSKTNVWRCSGFRTEHSGGDDKERNMQTHSLPSRIFCYVVGSL